MEAYLNRKYKFSRADEQYDNYLSTIGLSYLARKIAKSVPNYIELTKIGGDEYSFTLTLPFRTYQQKFVPGQEFDYETPEGRKVKNIFSFSEDNVLIEEQIEADRNVKIVREFSDKEVSSVATVKSKVGDLICKMWSDYVE